MQLRLHHIGAMSSLEQICDVFHRTRYLGNIVEMLHCSFLMISFSWHFNLIFF